MKKQSDPNGLEVSAPGAKLDAGKLKAGIIFQFPRALRALAEIAHYGHVEKGYSRGGWQDVEDGPLRYFDAFMRHFLNFPVLPLDPESGRKEIFHMLWNLAAVIELTERLIEKGELSNDTAYLSLCGTYRTLSLEDNGDRGSSDSGGSPKGESVLGGAGEGTGPMVDDCGSSEADGLLHHTNEDPLQRASRDIDRLEEERYNKQFSPVERPASPFKPYCCDRGSEERDRTLPTKSHNCTWSAATLHSNG